jgi:ATP-dependent helicase Lhr and Lhr-like helicase
VPRPLQTPPPSAASPLERWFSQQGWPVAAFQREAWDAYARGESGLIHAPTGTGKTLAAWGGPLLAARSAEEPLRVLWITPMRALAADTAENLQQAADALGVPWAVERRTGDTGAAARARQRKRLPQALVTTPESLSLLLSYADLMPQFAGLQAVIVDEWHELLGSKRGVQTELALARLRRLAPGLRVWGLSATLGNLDEALAVLLGPGRPGRLVGAVPPRALAMETLIPPTVERFPWSGHMGLVCLPQVVEALHAAASTLVFTNTRAQAERWFDALSMAAPELALGLHHGSLDAAHRADIEDGLRRGTLRAVVATSSLDLGVDFRPVEQVIQIGGPKGVARLLQRAGRSGHRPGAKSRLLCVPANTLEIAEFAAARRALAERRLEARRPICGALDLLAQHLVTLALTGRCTPAELLAEVRGTHAYAGLSETDWQWVLDFVQQGGSALKAYPQFRKVALDAQGRLVVPDATTARRHRLAVGTITADSMMKVAFVKGGGVGQVEESFIARLRPGETFLFGGRRLTLVRVKDMVAQVRAGGRGQTIPRFAGGKMPLSSTLAESLRALMAEHAAGRLDAGLPEHAAIAPLFDVQAAMSALPLPGVCLAERARSREGEHLFVYPFAGRHAHEGLSALLAWRLAQRLPTSFTFSFNDYGFELLAKSLPPVSEADLRVLLSPAHLEAELLQSLNAAEMAKRRFREVARVAGLVFDGYPGAGKTVKQVQLSSGLLYDVLARYDADNRLLRQALDEVLAQQLDLPRLRAALDAAQRDTIRLIETPRLTPLAFPLWAERLSSQLSSEDAAARIQRMAAELDTAPVRRTRLK